MGTGAGEGATGQDTGTAWVTRSADCPEAPAQAHPLAAANAHARTHARTDIASFLALRDDHPASDRRWDTPLSHDLPEPPC